LVARNKQIAFGIKEARMFRGVTTANQHFPGMPGERQPVSFLEALKGLGQWVNVFAEHAKQLLVAVDGLGRKSCPRYQNNSCSYTADQKALFRRGILRLGRR